jgi:hypothetical protein
MIEHHMTKFEIPKVEIGDILIARNDVALIVETSNGQPTYWIWLGEAFHAHRSLPNINTLTLLFGDRILLKPDGSYTVITTCLNKETRKWHGEQGWY